MEDLSGKVVGEYQLQRLLWGDTFYTAYLGYQEKLRRLVVVAVQSPILKGDEGKLIFLRGAEISANLQHPHIIPIIDCGFDENINRAYYVMAFLGERGGQLAKILRHKEFHLIGAKKLSTQLGLALDYAHGKGVTHGEINPFNIHFDNQGNSYLTGFGILTALMESDYKMVFAQPAGYIAPEIMVGNPVNAYSDIYSLALVIYKILTGRIAFESDNRDFWESTRMLLHELPTRPSELEPALSRQVDAVLFKALAKNPEERYTTAEEFANALDAAMSSITAAKHFFISYAKKDCFDLATRLVNELSSLTGATSWMDTSLEAGEDWAAQIGDEIDRCDCMIVLLSPDVNRPKTDQQQRSFVLKEIHYAEQNNKMIIPVMAQETKVPVQLSGIQHIDFTRDQEAGIQKLIAHIRQNILHT